MNEEYIETKKSMLKTLANKMYKMELDQWKKGKGDKPAPQKKEMKQTAPEIKKQEKTAPKIDDKVADMVKGFFKSKGHNTDETKENDKQFIGTIKRNKIKPPEKRKTKATRVKPKLKPHQVIL